jgi:hypothetical protein
VLYRQVAIGAGPEINAADEVPVNILGRGGMEATYQKMPENNVTSGLGSAQVTDYLRHAVSVPTLLFILPWDPAIGLSSLPARMSNL